MLLETPEEIYNEYQRFLKKKDFKRAYRSLERLIHYFPDDEGFLEEMVEMCLHHWERPEMAKAWLKKLTGLRSHWPDYAFLSRVEAELGHIDKARGYLKKAREMVKGRSMTKAGREARGFLKEIEELIEYKEVGRELINVALTRMEVEPQDIQRPTPPPKPSPPPPEKKEVKPAQVIIPTYTIPIKATPISEDTLRPFQIPSISPLRDCRLLVDYLHLTIQGSFDELLCLNAIAGVERYWYQVETVKKAIKYLHGRVLLCDEVGLGKTIEAGMLIKEYLMRGMVRNVLILTPPSLVSQWREEMEVKFGIQFLTTDGTEFANDPEGFWKERFIIASIGIAKGGKNIQKVTEQLYDLVVVDEAHHLRNRTTLAWGLVNQIKKRFIFLLTATPVQNNLIELFNLITLLKPGQFKTERQFRREYLKKGGIKAMADKERLRGLLRAVMIRNTRSVIDLKLPRRFATTMRLEPTEAEREVYQGIDRYLRGLHLRRPMVNLLLREAGSSPFALKGTISGMGDGVKDILTAIGGLREVSKGKALLDIAIKNPEGKKVVFTQFIKSMEHITNLLNEPGIPHVVFRGDMSTVEKDRAIRRFRDEVPILVSTESGGEGRNLQFCNTIINFDLPWNPMRIEQRIGRLHRIGQTRDVFIFNLSTKGTIEDYIIDILHNKINMFEMVIGEIEPILGYIGEDKDFEEIVMEIWLKSEGLEGLKEGFERLGNELLNAKGEYLKTKALDEEMFGEALEV
ncbi:MAG: DEAD/DEAH box helicase family protein [Deltaproteobacteria bacterium]|nr:DEAD/DEAH box helicase family protein [Deltaproteobacteria bacterium]